MPADPKAAPGWQVFTVGGTETLDGIRAAHERALALARERFGDALVVEAVSSHRYYIGDERCVAVVLYASAGGK